MRAFAKTKKSYRRLAEAVRRNASIFPSQVYLSREVMTDSEAILSDFVAIGDDFRAVFSKVKREHGFVKPAYLQAK